MSGRKGWAPLTWLGGSLWRPGARRFRSGPDVGCKTGLGCETGLGSLCRPALGLGLGSGLGSGLGFGKLTLMRAKYTRTSLELGLGLGDESRLHKNEHRGSYWRRRGGWQEEGRQLGLGLGLGAKFRVRVGFRLGLGGGLLPDSTLRFLYHFSDHM